MKLKRINPAHIVHSMDYSDRHSISLREYYERYPYRASVPTLTQRSFVRGIVERLRRKEARLEKIRSIRRRFIKGLTKSFLQLCRTASPVNPA